MTPPVGMEAGPVIEDCPFCGFKADSEYQIMLHMETLHAEGESPFVVKDDASIAAVMSIVSDPAREDVGDVQYANCPVEGCGEILLLEDFDSHIRLHDVEDSEAEVDAAEIDSTKRVKLNAEGSSSFATKLSRALRSLDADDEHVGKSSPLSNGVSDQQEKAKIAWKNLMKMPEASSNPKEPSSTSTNKPPKKRLGKAELGPHAHEKQMPSWLVKLLETQDGAFKIVKKVDVDGTSRKVQVSENHAVDVIPVIQQLLEQDPLTEYAYLCQPSVKHISKLKKEGGFCGYRNIQMLCSWIVAEKSQGFEHFKEKVPTIFEIQDYIETGWDLGINAGGRIETGGVRGTRKYIGTPEAQTMFVSLGIECETRAFKSAKNGTEALAYELLLNATEKYFIQGAYDFDSKFRRTGLPPIYFQQPGHSMTIIGFEMKKDGSRNILVFDPMFHDASAVTKYIGRKFTGKDPADLLRAYRRGAKYLRKYREFETLRLAPLSVRVLLEDDIGNCMYVWEVTT